MENCDNCTSDSKTVDMNSKKAINILRIGKHYHAFFIYYNEDPDKTWVINTADRLEKENYICYYEERDYIPGQRNLEMLLRNIKLAMKIVIVLSKDFLESSRCMYELNQAIEECFESDSNCALEALVPVKLDDCKIPRSLRVLAVLDVSKNGWWTSFKKSLDNDLVNWKIDQLTESNDLERSALEFRTKLHKSSKQDIELFLMKPIAFDLSHFLSQHANSTFFLSAMKTCGIEFKGENVYLNLQILKPFIMHRYNIAHCFLEHFERIPSKVSKMSLVFRNDSDLLDRKDIVQTREFNALAKAVLRTPSHSMWGLMWDMEGMEMGRNLRDACRSMVHDAITEKEPTAIAHPQYASFLSRLQTFVNWPDDKLPSKEAVAEAGYFCENSVVLRCFHCDGVSWDLKPHEDPWVRHAKWLHNCPYVKEMKGVDFVNKCRFDTKSKPSIYNSSYSDVKKRKYTYAKWPDNLSSLIGCLTNAGFYYTGIEDKVVCYQCGYGLRDWTPESDPWYRHAWWSPFCSYLNHEQGQDFIDKVQRDRKNKETTETFVITYSIQIRKVRPLM